MFHCTAVERELLARGGLNAHLLNKNFTVADAIFQPLADTQVEFDVVYNARLDPRKRHSGREAPRRMKSIYMASWLVVPGGCVFVHDCERVVAGQSLTVCSIWHFWCNDSGL